MKKTATLFIIMLCFGLSSQAQKLSKEENARYETEVKGLLTYLEETLNYLGDSTATPLEKEIIFTESWSKIFIDDKVQVEDDLDVNRKTPINKDVQAYLKDIDFFFKYATFKFDLQSISSNTREDGTIYYKANLSRKLTAKTISDETVDNIKNRFVEVNLDRKNNSLKIASIYTTKINEKEALRNWWNGLSMNWKNRLGGDIKLYDSISLATVGLISSADFMASYPVIDPMTGDTTLKDKFFKTEADMKELDSKLKLVIQKQTIDLSDIREIISLEPLSELSDLTYLNISGTSVDDIAPLRNANKLKALYANSTLIEDISALKYCITLEELELGNSNISELQVLQSLRNLKKFDISNTMVNRLQNLKNCPNLTTLNLSGCKLSNIVPLQDLAQLTTLDISNTSIRDLTPLSQLKELQSLNISSTAVVNLQPLSQLENLRELYCSNTNISDLTPLKNNRKLSKIYCDNSQVGDAEASDFTKENRIALVIYDTEALRNWWNDLPIYWKAVFSKQLDLESEPTTEQLHQIINMQHLELADNTYIQNLMPVSRLTNLKTLGISNTEINNLFAIQNLANLETLDISATHINSLKPLKDMRNLKRINIIGTPIDDLTPLIDDDNIEVIIADETPIGREEVFALKEKQRQVIVIYHTEELENWWYGLDDTWKAILTQHVPLQYEESPSALELQQIADLRELIIGTETPIVSLATIAKFDWLESLTINNQGVRELGPLANKTYLRELYAQNNPISDLKPLENDTQMEILDIENTQISDLGSIAKLTNLITLNVAGTNIKALKSLQNLVNLENLYINNTDVRNLSPIENLPKLKTLKAYNTKLNNKKISQLQEKRLDLNIIYY